METKKIEKALEQGFLCVLTGSGVLFLLALVTLVWHGVFEIVGGPEWWPPW